MKRRQLDTEETACEVELNAKDDVEEEKQQAAANTAKSNSNNCTSSTRLGKCEVCGAHDARYSCPKCEVKTCSVRCVQIHKKELACDGIRDRSKFIPLRKMSKMDFMSDYYFLEECTRYVEDRKSDGIKRFTRYNKVLPTHLFRLRNAASERKTTLRFLLQNFSRHKENTTYYDWKQKKIYWRIEWVFVNAGNLKYVDERCAEDIPLHKLLDKYVNPANVEIVPQKKSLEYYQSVGMFNLKVLLKAEGIKRCRSRFYALDVSKTLKENLADKTLVEFPCICVSYENNPNGFDIIDSDEDVESETKDYQSSLDELRKQQRISNSKSKNNSSDDEENDADEAEKLKKLLTEKRREQRRRKREEFENAPNNYLFADENLWDMLSTSSSEGDGNATEEEKEHDV